MTTKAKSKGEVKRTPRKKIGAAREKEFVEGPVEVVTIRRVSPTVVRARPVVADVNKAWFVGRLDEKEWSLRELARRMGLDVSAVSLMFDGKRKMTAAEAGKIAHLLGLPVQDVLANAGVDVSGAKSQSVALRGWVDPGGWVSMGGVMGPATVSGPVGEPGLEALRVQGGALDGWVLFYRHQSPGVRPEAIGKLCVVQEAGQAAGGPGGQQAPRLRVGWLKPGYEAGSWSLHPMDPVYDKAVSVVRVENAAPVAWVRQ